MVRVGRDLREDRLQTLRRLTICSGDDCETAVKDWLRGLRHRRRLRHGADDFAVDFDRAHLRRQLDAAVRAGRWERALMRDAQTAEGGVENVDARGAYGTTNRLTQLHPLMTATFV